MQRPGAASPASYVKGLQPPDLRSRRSRRDTPSFDPLQTFSRAFAFDASRTGKPLRTDQLPSTVCWSSRPLKFPPFEAVGSPAVALNKIGTDSCALVSRLAADVSHLPTSGSIQSSGSRSPNSNFLKMPVKRQACFDSRNYATIWNSARLPRCGAGKREGNQNAHEAVTGNHRLSYLNARALSSHCGHYCAQ
jgi:hypothetical protein